METPVKITMHIPFPIDKPNLNGFIFPSKCLDEFMQSAPGRPITTESSIVIGHITSVLGYDYREEALVCEGTLYVNGLEIRVPGFSDNQEFYDPVLFTRYVMR